MRLIRTGLAVHFLLFTFCFLFFARAALAGGVTLAEQRDRWVLRSDELQVEIDRVTGKVVSLVSLQPTPMPLQDPLGQGPEVTISAISDQQSVVREWRAIPAGKPILTKTERFGAKAYQASLDLRFEPGTSGDGHFSSVICHLSFLFSAECLEVSVRLEYLRDDPGRYILRVYHPFRPRDWISQSYITWYVWETYPPEEPVRTLYLTRAGDTPAKIDASVSFCYNPLGFLEGRDRQLFWGSLDIGSSFVIATNDPQDSLPSFSYTEVGLKKGDGYTLEYFLKPFPKQSYETRAGTEARPYGMGGDGDPPLPYSPLTTRHYLYSWKSIGDWYVHRWYSSDPLTRDLICSPAEASAWAGRPLPPGNMSGMAAAVPYPEMEQKMLAAHFTNCWSSVWWDIMGARAADLAEVKAQMRRKQELGFKLYLYFNANLVLSKADIDSPEERAEPPYKRWLNRNPDGSLMLAGEQLSQDSTSVVPDWCNKEWIEWYVGEVKRVIDYLEPDGIAWDNQGWGNVFAAPGSYSHSHPKSALQQGVFRAQAQISAWLAQAHPEMRVITNGVMGLAPTHLATDAGLREAFAGWLTEVPLNELFKVFNMTTLLLIDLPLERVTGDYDRYRDLPVLEQIYLRRMMLGLGFGTAVGAYGAGFVDHPPTAYFFRMPFMDKYQALYDFSKDIPATPLIGDDAAFSVQPEWLRLTSSLWGNKDRLLATVYNSGEEETAHHRVRLYRLNDGDLAVMRHLPSLEDVRRVDLLVYLSDWSKLAGPREPARLDGDLAVEINGTRYVLAPVGTHKGRSFGSAWIAGTDGYCTFEKMPLSLFREGENTLRFLRYEGSGDMYIGIDEEGQVMAHLVPYRSILGDEPGSPVTLHFPQGTVEAYGPADAPFTVQVISRYGRPRSHTAFQVRSLEDGSVEITGRLRRYELLLVRRAGTP